MSRHAEDLRVLVLEPYCGGSHKSFLTGLSRLPFKFEMMTFPARKWKWRMRFAAPYYAQKLHEMNSRFDRIICSTYVDVASFRGLAPAWVREVPLSAYFHENQFAYPVRVEDERDLHFAVTNMTTALAADSLAFNSAYNLATFLEGIKGLLKHSGDLRLDRPCEAIRAKSVVLPPGIDFTAIDDHGAEPDGGESPVVLWNHRWEHDKNPELFFEALFDLDREGVDFKVVVLGEAFHRRPPVFDEAEKRLSHRILHFGYAGSRRDYARWLNRGDIAVSTARHEFFGIAVIEAVRAGCRPLLPKRLSYPEMFPGEFLYEREEDFARRLKEEVLGKKRLTREKAVRLTAAYSWDALAPAYKAWIINARAP
jgi:glycosyltransferase involved in cell wall biosynthesis